MDCPQTIFYHLPLDYLSVTNSWETFQGGSVQINVEHKFNKYNTLRDDTVSDEELSEIFRSVSKELPEKSTFFFAQGFCFAIFLRNHSLYIFDLHSQSSEGFQTTSAALAQFS